MAININSLNNVLGSKPRKDEAAGVDTAPKQTTSNEQNKANAAGQAEKIATYDEAVHLSKTVYSISQIEESLSQDDGVDLDRVARIKEMIANNNYEYNANKIANGIINIESLLESKQ